MMPLVRRLGIRVYWEAFENLQDSLRTGLPVDAGSAGGGFWSYLAQHAGASQLFNEPIAAKGHGQIESVLAAYDFSPFTSIADVGGGHRHLLRAILAVTPASLGVLFDLPEVIELAAIGSSERLTLQAGNFFTDDLPTCDWYLIIDVLHNWSKMEALRILESARRATTPTGKLLVIATMLPEDARRS